jgi:hypothetical protein
MYSWLRQEAYIATQGRASGFPPWVPALEHVKAIACLCKNNTRPMATYKNKHTTKENTYQEKINTYTLYWGNGKREVLKGTDVIKALREAGYRAQDLRSLAFFTLGDNNDFMWIETTKSWDWYL